jgi:hypothetical protein
MGIAMSVAGLALGGCGGGVLSGGTAGSSGSRGGAGGAGVLTGMGGSIVRTDGGSDPFVMCSQPAAAIPLPPNHLILLDTSIMMNAIGCAPGCDTRSRWANAVGGINAAIGATQDRANWGLKLFGDGSDTCGASDTIDVPVTAGAAASIAAALTTRTTAAGDLLDPSNRSARNAVLAATRAFTAQQTRNPSFIVLLTAGAPGCAAGSTDPNVDDTAATVDAITAAGSWGFGTRVAALGEVDGPTQTSLLAMAAAGHPGLPGPHAGYAATLTSSDLEAVLRSLVGDTEGCTFALPPPPNELASNSSIVVLWGGFEIPRDPSHAEGWDYTDASSTVIQLYGTGCDVARADRTQLPVIRHRCILI